MIPMNDRYITYIVDIIINDPVACWEGIRRSVMRVSGVRCMDLIYMSELYDRGFIEFRIDVDNEECVNEIEKLIGSMFFVKRLDRK